MYYLPGPGDMVLWPKEGLSERPNTFDKLFLKRELKYDPVLFIASF